MIRFYFKRIKSIIVILLFLTLFLSVSCQPGFKDSGNTIRLKGSYTMYELSTALAAEFMAGHPGISVYVEGGGTSTGFKGLEEGNIDIAMASRLIRSGEASALAVKYGKLGISFLVAKDALSIYVNKENPVTNLSLAQLKSIFTGIHQN
ncbi:MAG: substrate-binding domain-containing protein, partial [Calditrichaceae bacterium]